MSKISIFLSSHKLSSRQVRSFQKMIFSWWKDNRRDLPWRHTRDPYKILVSEVMLQQTQVSRVLPKYIEFLKKFPDVFRLAAASPAEVIRTWKGLGYNRRALYLLRAAKSVLKEYKGKFPKNEQELCKLPGSGTYTARAILVFAYKQEVPLIDTNIRRIITHFFFNDQPQKTSVIEDVARQLLPKGKSWEWHQALMDYGASATFNRQQTTNNKKKTIPFRESNRFYRGRIIDLLREKDIPEAELVAILIKKYQRTKVFFQELVDDLDREGLADRSKTGVIGLPVNFFSG